MKQRFKEQPFLDILMKKENGQQYLHFKSHYLKNHIKSIPYTLERRICTIVTNKNIQKTHLEELRVSLHQSGYLTTLIDKGFELTEKKYH